MGILKKISLLTIFLSSFVIPSHFTAEERPIYFNFWPLFQYTSDPIRGEREIEGLGPFFHWKKDSHQGQWGIRPIFCMTEDEDEFLRRFEFFYPLGKYQVKEGEKKGYLAPLSVYREEEVDGRKKWDFQFFPFFIGETERGSDYFGIFPIYGTLSDRYGNDEIRFYFWPLYGESLSDGVRTTNLLWPFISFTEGEKRKGYRFWPFYGQKEEFGVSTSEFVLWPIFIKQTKGLDTEDPVEEKMIFPFYISKESKHIESKTFLWPFFSHTRSRLTGFEQWDLPWPFFQSLRGENLYGIKIFPAYGYKEKEGEWKRIFILYPFLKIEEDQTKEVHEETIQILLLSRIRRGENDQGMEQERSFRIWPLFDFKRGETGREMFSFLYLIPFKDEGLERNLYPLFQIFRWEKDPQGGISTNLLWGFYKRMKKEEMDSWEVAHLIGLRREKEWKKLSFLKGLFLYESDGKTADLRLFYLPFHIQWPHLNPKGLSLEKWKKSRIDNPAFQSTYSCELP